MFLSHEAIPGYPWYLQESIGGVSWPNFGVVNETIGQSLPNRNLRLGQYVTDRDGNFYQVVKAGAGLTIGQAVKRKAGTTGVTAAVAGIADNIHILKVTIAGLTANGEVGNFLAIALSATSTVFKRIKANTATSGGVSFITISQKDIRFARGDYDADALAAAVGAGLLCTLYRPYVVDVAGAGEVPVGVALGTVTSGNLTGVQVHGPCMVASVGDTLPLADGVSVQTTAAGAVMGQKGAPSGTEAQLALAGRVGVALMANTAAAGAFSAVGVDLFGRW